MANHVEVESFNNRTGGSRCGSRAGEGREKVHDEVVAAREPERYQEHISPVGGSPIRRWVHFREGPFAFLLRSR